MANKLTVSVDVVALVDGTELQFSKRNVSFRTPGDNYNYTRQTIGTTQESLNMGDVATPGFLVIENTGDYSVEIAETGCDGMQIPAGEVALIPVASTGVSGRAITSSTTIRFLLLEYA